MTPSAQPRLCLELPALDPRRETDSVRRTNAIVRELLARRYPLADAHDADLVVAGGLAPGRLDGPPRFVLPHGALGDPGHWLVTVPELRVCDVLALASRSDAAIVARMAGEPFCTRVELPLFVDTDFFSPAPEGRAQTRRRHGLDATTPLLLAVSTLDPQKNLADALRLCAELRREHPDLVLAIAGAGGERERATLEALARELGLGSALRLLGLQSPEDVRDLYRSADLFVHLTLQRKESFGLAPVEAQACGLPVLASAWGGVRDTVLPGETGFYAPVRLGRVGRSVEWTTLREPALKLLGDPATRQRLSARARVWASEHYSMGAFAARLGAAIDGWWSTRPAEPVRRRVLLSRAADPLLVAFAELALRHPHEDSRALSDRLAASELGATAQRLLFECMT